MIPLGYLIDLSSNCKAILVGLGSPNPNFLKVLHGITSLLIPKSSNAFLSIKLPIKHRRVKFPESFNFCCSLFQETDEHSSLDVIVDNSSIFPLFVSRSFRNVGYLYLGQCFNDREVNMQLFEQLKKVFKLVIHQVLLQSGGIRDLGSIFKKWCRVDLLFFPFGFLTFLPNWFFYNSLLNLSRLFLFLHCHFTTAS